MCLDTSDDEYGEGDNIETERAIEVVTDTARANLITDMVAHPKEAPCMQELEHLNPSLEPEEIRHHLGVLQEVGLVKTLELEPENRVRNLPHTFYSITTEARELFDKHGVFPREPWKRQYSRIQKPREIRELEEIPRP